MTQREVMEALFALEAIEGMEDELFDGIQGFAEKTLAKMDADNEKNRLKNAEKAKERDAFALEFAQNLGDEPMTATDVHEQFGHLIPAKVDKEGNEKPLTIQAVSALLRKATALGALKVQDVKVAKKGTQKGYTRA